MNETHTEYKCPKCEKMGIRIFGPGFIKYRHYGSPGSSWKYVNSSTFAECIVPTKPKDSNG